MSLKDKLLKNSTIKYTSTLTDSKVYKKKDLISTPVPMINVALSGSLDGGLMPGLTMISGPSRHFKSGFGLLLVSSFLKKHPDGIVLFYDSEFGTPESYIQSFEINKDSIVHTPITDIEELKFDIAAQLKEITREDKVFILVDSIGNLASKKEVDDANDGKSVVDMSRAKSLKSLFRIITPHLQLKDIPMVVINHTYKEIGMYPKDIVSGGTGAFYSSDNIWILGRQQEKDGTEISGYHFVINVEKSRFVREKSKIPITISYEGGINKWSGLFDIALEGNYLAKPKQGWYALVDRSTGEIQEKNYRANDIIENASFWKTLFEKTDFKQYIENRYKVGTVSLLGNDTEET